MKSFYVFLVSVFCVLGFMQQGSLAYPISGKGPLGSYVGGLSYSFTSSTAAELKVEITNTSVSNNGGYLTAFAFNNPLNSISSVLLVNSNTDYQLIGGPKYSNKIKSKDYGDYDIGASLSNKFDKGGDPKRGIGVGSTEIFTFSLIGKDLGSLSTQDFLDESSKGKKNGGQSAFFIAKFRGFDEGGDNESPADPANTPIPEPTTILLLGIGLVGLAGAEVRRRRKKKAVDHSKDIIYH